MKRTLLLAVAALALVSLLMAGLVIRENSAISNRGYEVSLQPPLFVQPAYAKANSPIPEIAERLDAEAGISAYYQTPGAIDLSLVRGQFRTIEIETADYIIGSVAIPNRNERFDAHAYVHKDGWILAYYMKDEPASKMMEPSEKTIDTTKFTTVLSTLAGSAGHPFSGEEYYDFRFPNATNMLFVVEEESNGNDFTITLPSAYGYFERSWAAYDNSDEVDFYLDGVNLWGSASFQSDKLAFGYITVAQLLPDIEHMFSVEDNKIIRELMKIS